nr:immunoglobulin heavy chain junction region [Mus musculus]
CARRDSSGPYFDYW